MSYQLNPLSKGYGGPPLENFEKNGVKWCKSNAIL